MSGDPEVAGMVSREPTAGNPPDEAAIRLALETVRASDRAGVCTGVLEIAAVLSADGVRRELLHTAGQTGVLVRGRRVLPGEVDQALAELIERSLLVVSPEGQSVAMSGPVARVVRAGLADPVVACLAAASMLKARADVLADSLDRAAILDLSAQVNALQQHVGPTTRGDERLSRAMLRLRFWALYQLIELGDCTAQAIEVGEPLTAELERALGPDHPDTLNARNSLAAAYQAAGRPADAIPLFEQTLVARERVLGPAHPDTLTSQNNLAATYQDVGRYVEAILLFKLTLAARERLLGADHPSTLNSRSNLAAAFRATGRVSEAIPLLAQILAGRQRTLRPGHPDVQAARESLAAARKEADRAAESASLAPAPELPTSVGPPPDEPVSSRIGPPLAVAAVVPPADLDAGERLAGPDAEASPAEPEAGESPAGLVAEAEPGGQGADGQLAEPEADEPPATSADQESLEDAGTVTDAAGQPPAAREPEPPAAREPEPPREREPELAGEPAPGPGTPTRGRPARRQRRGSVLIAVIVVLLAAGGAAVALIAPHSGPGSAATSQPTGHQPAGTASQLAAAWVAQQVARNAIVACDPLMCSVLEAQGVPAANLLVLRTRTTSPLEAQVVVVTAAVRSQFGSSLDSEYAPWVIAGFGSGPDQVSVQVVATNGPTAYQSALRQDLADRRAAGAELTANKRIKATPVATAELAAGAVDARLLIMLPALAAVHPIQILTFGHPVPGASSGVPLCSAELSGSGRPAGMTDASYLGWLTSFLRAQLAPFHGAMTVLTQAGQPVVRVVFAQPSPLGLLAHS